MINIKELEEDFRVLENGTQIKATYCNEPFEGIIIHSRKRNEYTTRYEVEVLKGFTFNKTYTRKSGEVVFIDVDSDGCQS